MKPLSQEAVKRLALAHGGKLELEGRSVNAARSKTKVAYMQPKTKPSDAQTMQQLLDPELREAILSIAKSLGQIALNTTSSQRI